MKLLIPTFMFFFSLAASAAVMRRDADNYDDYCWTSNVGRCFEILGIAEGCGWDNESYTSTVSDECLLECICSTSSLYSALQACASVIPPEYVAEYKGTFEHICDHDGTPYDGTYSLKDRSISARSGPTEALGAFSSALKGSK